MRKPVSISLLKSIKIALLFSVVLFITLLVFEFKNNNVPTILHLAGTALFAGVLFVCLLIAAKNSSVKS